MTDWTFLTDHAHVLVVLAREPRGNVAVLARETGLEPARIGTILRDLEAAGYVERTHRGGTTYTIIDRTKPLRHPVERHHPVGRLLDAVQSPADVLRDRLAAPD
jgi:DNA-binding IclR family transcriptional regulator